MTPANIPLTQTQFINNTINWITAPDPIDTPQPINTTFGILFNTGSQTKLNQLTLYLRNTSNIPILESTLQGQNVGTLDGYSLSNSDNLPTSLSTPSSADFNITADLQWGQLLGHLGYQITLKNSVNPIIYQFNSVYSAEILSPNNILDNNKEYLFYISLEDETMQATIYPVNIYEYLDANIFTTTITDSSVFTRTSGSIGLYVNMQDIDANVISMRPYHTVFSAFESHTYNSITPVDGAQIFANTTPPTQLFFPPLLPLTSSDNVTPTINYDSGRTTTGQSSRITFGLSEATTTFQGFKTKPLSPYLDNISGITDYYAISASLDVWIESSALTYSDNPFVGLLVNEAGYGIPLLLPTIAPNKWIHATVNLLVNPSQTPYVISENINTLLDEASWTPINALVPSGLYTFVILYTGGNPTTIWIDNVQISQNSVEWYARTTKNDPFVQNLSNWIPFSDTVNSPTDGIRFSQPGNTLQIKAEALHQDSQIYNGYTLIPSYAKLGRIVMNKQTTTTIPTYNGTNGIELIITPIPDTENSFELTCNLHNLPNGIYNIEWSFGNNNFSYDQIINTSNLSSITRTYSYILGTPSVSNYYITAHVIDNNGNQGYDSKEASIS